MSRCRRPARWLRTRARSASGIPRCGDTQRRSSAWRVQNDGGFDKPSPRSGPARRSSGFRKIVRRSPASRPGGAASSRHRREAFAVRRRAAIFEGVVRRRQRRLARRVPRAHIFAFGCRARRGRLSSGCHPIRLRRRWCSGSPRHRPRSTTSIHAPFSNFSFRASRCRSARHCVGAGRVELREKRWKDRRRRG